MNFPLPGKNEVEYDHWQKVGISIKYDFVHVSLHCKYETFPDLSFFYQKKN